mmetsp:Transcript_1577/g.1385  ORF Transcript_1577/g.1385 Transcript_1577/m.1385 type:complete len:142 (-) Transcript_1577:28-453(-)
MEHYEHKVAGYPKNLLPGVQFDNIVYWGHIMLMEIFATFLFLSVILAVKYGGAEKYKGTGPLAICLTLYTMIEMGGSVSGSAFNPMIGIVLNTYGYAIKNDYYTNEGVPYEQIKYVWIYIIGPLAGGFLAAMFNNFQEKFK